MAEPQLNTENVAIMEVVFQDDAENLFCIFCLQQTGRYYELLKCHHVDFLGICPVPEENLPENVVICFYCHSTFKKIKLFKKQIQTSFDILNKEAGNIVIQDHQKKKLTAHKTVQLTIPEKNIKRKTVLPKTNNIETAFDIINSNTTSLQAFTSNNLKSMTEALLSVASGHLNLESQNSQPVLPTNHDCTKEVGILDINIDNISEVVNKQVVQNNTQSDTGLPHEINKADEVEVTVESVYGTSVLPEIKNETQVVENGSMDEDYSSDSDEDEFKDHTPPNSILPVTLSTTELKEERLTTLQSHDYLRFPFRCDNCLIVFNFKENFEDHVKRKHGMTTGRVNCEICQQMVENKDLNNHILRHYERLECNKCKKRFLLYDEACNHYKNEHMHSKRKIALEDIDNHCERKMIKQSEEDKNSAEDIGRVYYIKESSSTSVPQLITSD